MSEYLGWVEKNAPRARFDRDIIPGGPETAGYEAYVRNVFRPGQVLSKKDPGGMSASTLLRMENELGKHALDDSSQSRVLAII
jgi:hypothetical protein